MDESKWMWDTGRDIKQAQDLEKYIIEKIINVIEEKMKTSERISPSILIEEIKRVMEYAEE